MSGWDEVKSVHPPTQINLGVSSRSDPEDSEPLTHWWRRQVSPNGQVVEVRVVHGEERGRFYRSRFVGQGWIAEDLVHNYEIGRYSDREDAARAVMEHCDKMEPCDRTED